MLLPILVSLTLAFFQNDYHIKYERHNVTFSNKDYFQNENITYYFYNRSTRLLSWSGDLLKKIGPDMKVFGKKLVKDQEYRFFPVFYEENPCVAIVLDKFGAGMRNFNTNVRSCPLEKGFYYLSNAKLNQSRLPPHAPRGRFMFEVELYDKKVLLISGNVYIQVVPTDPLEIVRN
ncbi:hypothetical protein FQR65_LT09325 [Abscondita terminalis]|nr:hypothetical protein FQR65_LT09325 [Abscondita terminalis]